MLKVLLIDDNAGDRALAIRQLNQGFSEITIIQITGTEEFAQALQTGNFNLVITDYKLQWSNGITILQTIKSREPDCPVIIFTNSGSQEIAVEAMKAGLDDYVIKSPQQFVRLAIAVRLAWLRAEERRQTTRLELRLQSLLNRLNVGVYRASLDGKIIEANTTFLQLLGYSTLEEAASVNLNELFGDTQNLSPIPELGSTEGQTPAQELQIRKADGCTIWVNWSKAFSSANQEIFVDGLVENITDRKQAEAARQESEERFRLMADTAPVYLWMSGLDKFCYFFNKSWLEFTGRTLEQEVGEGWTEGVHPDDFTHCLQTYSHSFDARQNFTMEYRLRGFDGQYRWVLDSGTPRFAADGTFVGYIGSCIDISDRKQLEDTLRQKAKQLEEANRLKDEFLAVLSHELRTPLNAILGWAKMLRSGKVTEPMVARALETIERNARLQAHLVEDVLDVSQIIQGKFNLTVYPTSLFSPIDAAIELVQPAAKAKDIQLISELNPSVGEILGDPNRLQQVIWNLLSNAAKFTPSGGTVKISLLQVESYAQIRVQDTGMGISADFLPYVFDRFRQADSSITRSYGGLGLGLAIVRHLVELHGGTVRAESPGIGQGAVFIVQIPLINPQRHSTQNLRITSNPASNSSTIEGLRVLVADDDSDVRELLTAILQSSGVRVTAVDSATEALRIIQSSTPDCLVSDIAMPHEDGYSLIRKVRSLPSEQGRNIPAIALTAYAMKEEQQQAISAGFQLHVSKPVEPEVLVAAIANVIRRTSAAP